MQGLILQLTRAGFLLLLWFFVWAVLRTLRSDIYAAAGMRVPARYSGGSKVLPSFNKQKVAKYLVVTQGGLAGTQSEPTRPRQRRRSTIVVVCRPALPPRPTRKPGPRVHVGTDGEVCTND